MGGGSRVRRVDSGSRRLRVGLSERASAAWRHSPGVMRPARPHDGLPPGPVRNPAGPGLPAPPRPGPGAAPGEPPTTALVPPSSGSGPDGSNPPRPPHGHVQRVRRAPPPRCGRRRETASGAASGEEKPPATATRAGPGEAGTGSPGAAAAEGRGVVGRSARPRTAVWEIRGAQPWQISARVQTWPTAGLWMRTRSGAPVQEALVSWWKPHSAARQAHAAWGRTVASRACARTCSAANRRMADVSLERGGMRHASVLQVTETVWSPWPVRRTVQVRPGTRDPGIMVKAEMSVHICGGLPVVRRVSGRRR